MKKIIAILLAGLMLVSLAFSQDQLYHFILRKE